MQIYYRVGELKNKVNLTDIFDSKWRWSLQVKDVNSLIAVILNVKLVTRPSPSPQQPFGDLHTCLGDVSRLIWLWIDCSSSSCCSLRRVNFTCWVNCDWWSTHLNGSLQRRLDRKQHTGLLLKASRGHFLFPHWKPLVILVKVFKWNRLNQGFTRPFFVSRLFLNNINVKAVEVMKHLDVDENKNNNLKHCTAF